MVKSIYIPRSPAKLDIAKPAIWIRIVQAWGLIALCAVFWLSLIGDVAAQSRIKDIVDFEGVRDNQLVGYGLVVGVNGTGDSFTQSVFTRESLIGMLERLGINARDEALGSDNVAAVMVTATLPAFARQGSRLDVTVSAMGDAESLQGGTLLVTPLLGADGEIYAVAQGNVAVGGFQIQGQAEALTRGVPTSGRIASGAIIEREIPFAISDLKQIHLSLRNPDFTTARRISHAINAFIGVPTSDVLDPGTVRLNVPPAYANQLVELLTDIEQLRITPDQIAKVIIDEQTGTIVMGENVRINRIAIAQGNLSIRVTDDVQVALPQPFTNTGALANQPDEAAQPAPGDGPPEKFGVMEGGVTLQDLVNGLNALGVGPRDLITILQAIKAADALQAEIQVM